MCACGGRSRRLLIVTAAKFTIEDSEKLWQLLGA
jgi:hypothetical protein